MLRFLPVAAKRGQTKDAKKPATFGIRKLEPRLESSFVFPAETYTGLKLNGGKKGEKSVPKKN